MDKRFEKPGMRIGLYSRGVSEEDAVFVAKLVDQLQGRKVRVHCYAPFRRSIAPWLQQPEALTVFSDAESFAAQGINYLISIGGDGTFLDTLQYVHDNNVPVMGINTGTLGFLSSVPRHRALQALEALLAEEVIIDERSMLRVRSNKHIFDESGLALNDFTIQKRDTGSMIVIKAFLNGELLTTYWSDGLIVSTPTGSTAYSLSCGGPVIFPDSHNFVLTPVAPHNLNVRPVVVSDSSVLSFEVSGRGSSFLVSLDSKSAIIDYSYQLAVCKAANTFKTVRLNNQDFIATLREKLMWGMDNRNNLTSV